MSEKEYVPQAGDIVDGGYGVGGGIYIGRQAGRGDGRHVLLGEGGKNCTIVASVQMSSSALTLSGGYRSYYSDASLAEDGVRLLASVCEGREGLSPGMSTEMAAWWDKAKLPMAKVCFVDSWLKIKKAREDIATIERIGGFPSTEMQERVEAAEHELAARRARVLLVFGDQIAVARAQYKVEDVS